MLIKALMQIDKLLVMLALAGLAAGQSRAGLMTFDTLSSYSYVPNGYSGLNWDNFMVVDGRDFTDDGYHTGVVSPNMVAFNAYAHPATISGIGGATFQLNSAYLTAAFYDGQRVEVLGKLGGVTIYDDTYVLKETGPSLVAFDPAAVDTVIFNSGYNQFVMDNLTVGVPEPSQFALGAVTLLGALGFGYRHWRKTDKA